MSAEKENVLNRRTALLSLIFLGAGTALQPNSAKAAGAPLNDKEAEEYAKLLQEVCIERELCPDTQIN